MSTPRSRRRREIRPEARPGAHGDGITVGQWLKEVSRDVQYLAWKESIGEPLSASERALLDAHRHGAQAAALMGPGGGA